ncbi:MAG: transhydrogenase subunit alpha [Planctomycetota bacterium]
MRYLSYHRLRRTGTHPLAIIMPLSCMIGSFVAVPSLLAASDADAGDKTVVHVAASPDVVAMAFVFMLATFIGIGVIRRVSRLLHTPLMSLTNAISAISVVGATIVAGGEHYPTGVRVMGAIALFASMTNIVSGFLITDRMLKMFKTREGGKS